MKIMMREAAADGSRPPIQTWPGETTPKDYLILPEELDDGTFEEANGFVTLSHDGERVTAMTANEEARSAWLAGRVEEESAPSAADTTLELLADHEYRLCLLELGAVE